MRDSEYEWQQQVGNSRHEVDELGHVIDRLQVELKSLSDKVSNLKSRRFDDDEPDYVVRTAGTQLRDAVSTGAHRIRHEMEDALNEMYDLGRVIDFYHH